MFKEHDVIQTSKVVMRVGTAIPAKSTGTIIHVYENTKPRMYLVELPVYRSSPLIVALSEDEIEKYNDGLPRPDINLFKPERE